MTRKERAANKDDEERAPDGNAAGFLRDMEKNVYTSGDMDMEDRVKRNRHFQQRGGDEANSFRR